jgi:adenylosuccinate lyase
MTDVMELSSLTAVSPVDGRYHRQTSPLSPYFSEYGLMRYRVQVEVEYFLALARVGVLPHLPEGIELHRLRDIYNQFAPADAARIKEIEATTNHDVKAVEYYLKERFKSMGIDEALEYVHFGLTSQDINNTAIPMSLRDGLREIYLPALQHTISTLGQMSTDWQDVPMLARTHGQPASPTRLGKEIAVYVERLNVQVQQLAAIPHSAKFGGATGNFNAHHVAYPHIDWVDFANLFVNNTLGLHRSTRTTQIEHYDNMAALFDCLKRINTILIDLCRDMWTYISIDYFKQQLRAGEIGSSAMPHKVNPIDFENAEGNLGIANALYEHLAAKLPVSRLQRDLTDSTVLRNIGVPISHALISINSINKGLGKLILNLPQLAHDLEQNWAVTAEAIQTILRREGYPQPYEQLKELTRGAAINKERIHNFIDTLAVTDAIKIELKGINPHNYTGIK